MKRFITTVLSVSVFFVGLGAMAAHVGAKFKSDEKALEIIRAARAAIGGEAAIRDVKSLVIIGKTTNSFTVNGIQRSETGETEIAFQLPDKMMKTVKIGDPNLAGHSKIVSEQRDVFVVGKADGDKVDWKVKDGEFTTNNGEKFTLRKGENGEFVTDDGKKVIVRTTDGSATASSDGTQKIIVRKKADGGEWTPKEGDTNVFVRKHDDGGTWMAADGKHVEIAKARGGGHEGMRQNELLRTTLGLLLTAPDGMDVTYTFVGDGDVDGMAVNIVNAAFAGADYRLFIGKGNNLPVAISFKGHAMPEIVHFDKKIDTPMDGNKDVLVFKRNHEGMGKSAEMTVKFSDFRSAGGVQLPYKWTTVSGGQTVETFDVSSYDVNPANIADRFKDQNVVVRMKHPDSK